MQLQSVIDKMGLGKLQLKWQQKVDKKWLEGIQLKIFEKERGK